MNQGSSRQTSNYDRENGFAHILTHYQNKHQKSECHTTSGENQLRTMVVFDYF